MKEPEKLKETTIKALQGVDRGDEFFEGMAFALGISGSYSQIKGMADFLRSVQPQPKK
jgi:hypothetical protein